MSKRIIPAKMSEQQTAMAHEVEISRRSNRRRKKKHNGLS